MNVYQVVYQSGVSTYYAAQSFNAAYEAASQALPSPIVVMQWLGAVTVVST